jgi:hypothetical protein
MTIETEAPQGLAEAEPVIQPEEAADAGPAPEASETPEPAAEAQPEPAKQTPWWQKRIDEVTKQKYDANARAEKAEAEAASMRLLLEAQGADLRPTDDDAPPADGRKYTQAELDKIAEDKARVIADRRAFDARANAAYDAGETAFGKDAFASAIGNLRSAGVISAQDIGFLEAALETDAPEKVLHALGQDPDEAMRIAGLPLGRRAIELDRLAQKLNAKAPPETRKAPPPVTPIEGSADPAFDPEKASMAEFIKWRESQKRA